MATAVANLNTHVGRTFRTVARKLWSPKAQLLHPEDYDEVKKLSQEKRWSTLYADALMHQGEQDQEWKKIMAPVLKPKERDPNDPKYKDEANRNPPPLYTEEDLAAVKKAHEKFVEFKTTKDLQHVNEDIAKLNKNSVRDPIFGQVAEIPLRNAYLLKPDEWTDIKSKGEAVKLLSPIYSLGYAIQTHYNNRIGDPETGDAALVDDIIAELRSLNRVIEGFHLDGQNREFGFFALPPDSGGAFRTSDEEDEDEYDEDAEMENAEPTPNFFILDKEMAIDTMEVPASVQKIRRKLGGGAGILQRLLLTYDAERRTYDPTLRAAFDLVQNEILEETNKLNITPKDAFVINLGQVQFVNELRQAKELYERILEDPGDLKSRAEYISLRKAAKNFCDQKSFPGNFTNVFAPSIKPIIDAASKRSKEMAGQLLLIRREIEGPTGSLHRYIYSQGKDEEARRQIDAVNQSIREKCREKKIIDNFSLDPDVLLPQLIELVGVLNDLSQNPVAGPRYKEIFDQACSKLTGPGLEGLKDAVLGGLPTPEQVQRKQEVPAPAPPAENDVRTFLRSTPTAPDEVREMVNGSLISKRICSVRSVNKTANQFLLKFIIPGFTEPAFQLARCSKYKGALARFKANGGQQFIKADSKDLNGVAWNTGNCAIGGIASIERDPEDAYSKNAVTFILACLDVDGNGPSKWFPRSVMYDNFGIDFVNSESAWLKKTGQEIPKAPVPYKARKRLLENEKQRRDLSGQDYPSRKEPGKYGKFVKSVLRADPGWKGGRHKGGFRGNYGGGFSDFVRPEWYRAGQDPDEEDEEGESTVSDREFIDDSEPVDELNWQLEQLLKMIAKRNKEQRPVGRSFGRKYRQPEFS